MAAKRSRSRKQPRPPDPEDVLKGRVTLDPLGLVALIRRVNPTDRRLPQSQMRRRYEQKSRLQALLIQRCGAELEVVRDPALDGAPLLRHRPSGQSACHVRVDEIADDEARRWIRRQLDLEQDEDTPPPGDDSGAAPELPGEAGPVAEDGLDGKTPAELRSAAQQALQEYDYDGAKLLLVAAFRRSGGGSELALPLLDLLVDHLAAYREALDLGDELSAEAQADPGVRSLLGVAAAHEHEAKRATRWIRGLDGPRVLDVYVTLAAQALKEEDEAAAAAYLAKAKEAAPPSAGLIRLEQQLAEQRRERLAPLEAQATASFEAGDLAEAERRARDLLSRDDQSAVARRLLDQIRRHRRAEQAAEVLARAEDALQQGEHATAIKLLERALSLGADPAAVQPRLALARSEERERSLAAEVAKIRQLVAADSTRAAGLLAYLGHDRDLRGRLREQISSPLLGWLEDAGAPSSAGKARAAVEAVLALEAAQGALAEGNVHKARELLSAHDKVLRSIAVAQQALEQAAAGIRREQEDRARAGLEQAAAALAAGDLPRARELVTATDPQALASHDRRSLEQLSAELGRAEAARRLAAEVEQQLAGGDLLAARAAAAELAARQTGAEQAVRQRQVTELSERIRRKWCLQICDEEAALTDMGEVDRQHPETPALWICPGGTELVLATTRERWIFLRVVDLGTRRVKRSVMLRAPKALTFPRWIVAERSVWIAGQEGGLLQLDRETWDIRSYHDLRAFLRDDEHIQDVLLVPDSRYLWLLTGKEELEDTSLKVIDLARWRVHRQLSDDVYSCVRVGCGASPVIVSIREGTPSIHNVRGGLLPGMAMPVGSDLTAAAPLPAGEGLLVAYGYDEEQGLRLGVLARGKGLADTLAYDRYNHGYASKLATSRAEGLIFLLAIAEGLRRDLVALRCSGSQVEEIYCVSAPRDTVLATSGDEQRVVAVIPSDDGLRIVPLSAQPPVFEPPVRAPIRELRLLGGRGFHCTEPARAGKAWSLAIMAMLRDTPPEQLGGFVDRYRLEHEGDAASQLALCRALEQTAHAGELAQEQARWALERHPQHAPTVLHNAQLLAERSEWAEICPLLGSIGTDGLEPSWAQHYHHLFAAGLLVGGTLEQAHSQLQQGLAIAEGGCELDKLLPLTEPLPEPLEPADWGPDQPLVRQLRGAVKTADAHLARGDATAALAAVNRPPIWRSWELQSLGRLAEAALLVTAATGRERLHRVFAVATFCAAHGEQFTSSLPLAEATWDEARLDELNRRAREWLDRLGPDD